MEQIPCCALLLSSQSRAVTNCHTFSPECVISTVICAFRRPLLRPSSSFASLSASGFFVMDLFCSIIIPLPVNTIILGTIRDLPQSSRKAEKELDSTSLLYYWLSSKSIKIKTERINFLYIAVKEHHDISSCQLL